MSKRLMSGRIVVAVVALVLIGTAWQAVAQQGEQDRQAQAQDGQRMQCPMMSAMKGLKLHAETPAVLLAMKEELDLSQEQTRRLEELASDVREQASKILTEEQQQQIAQAPQGPLSMMQVMMLLQKHSSDQQEQEQMCPMCMKMMRDRAGQRQQEQDKEQDRGEHQGHHQESERRP